MGVEAPPAAADASPAPSFRPLQAMVALGGIQALTMLAGLIRSKILAVMLGPAGVGVAGVVDQAVSLVAQLGSLSVPFVALKFLSRARDASSHDVRRVYTALLGTIGLCSVVSAAIATVIAAWRPGIFGDGLVPYRSTLVAAVLGVVPFALAPFYRNVMAALERHRQSALAAFFTAVLTVAGAYLGVRTGGLVGLFIANGVVLAVTVVGMHLYLSRRANLGVDRSVTPASSVHVLRAQPGLSSFAGSMYVLALTSPLAYLLARSTLLSTRGETDAGLVAAAYGIAVAVRLVLNQANGLYLTPLVNRDTAKAERLAAVAEYLRVLIVLVALALLAIALFPRQWLLLLYSVQFTDAVPLVTLFLLAEGILLVAGVYQALLIGFDDISGFLTSTVMGQLAIIALASVLVPEMGGAGVATAFLVGNAVILVGTATRLATHHGGRALLLPLVPLSVALGATALAGWWAPRGDGAAWKAAAYVASLALALAFLRPDERRWLFRPWTGRARRPT